jgi:hypothetical protein
MRNGGPRLVEKFDVASTQNDMAFQNLILRADSFRTIKGSDSESGENLAHSKCRTSVGNVAYREFSRGVYRNIWAPPALQGRLG